MEASAALVHSVPSLTSPLPLSVSGFAPPTKPSSTFASSCRPIHSSISIRSRSRSSTSTSNAGCFLRFGASSSIHGDGAITLSHRLCWPLSIKPARRRSQNFQVTSTAMRLVTFVTRKRRVLALFRTFSHLNLKKPAPTRFAFYFLVLERLVKVKEALRRMVSSESFREFMDVPHAAFFRSTVFGEPFWRDAEEIAGVLLPIFRVLRLVDREGCTLGLIYEFMDRIGEGIQTSPLVEHRRREISRIWEARWDYFHRPIHAVAHILHPLWRDTRDRDDLELHRGWVEYTERVWPGPGPMLTNIAYQLLIFERYQFPFDGEQSRRREDMLRPVSWWGYHGRGTGDLRRLAERVLAQDCSAGACERNWSTWALYHTQKRNRLSIEQCRRLVFVNTNGRMLRRTRGGGHLLEICAVKKTFSSFDDMIQNSEVPVLVDFYATWCGPCQYMVPILHDVGNALKDKISIVKIDSDKYPNLAGRYEVHGLPTLLLFDHGKPIDRLEGVVSAPKLIERIQHALSKSRAGV